MIFRSILLTALCIAATASAQTVFVSYDLAGGSGVASTLNDATATNIAPGAFSSGSGGVGLSSAFDCLFARTNATGTTTADGDTLADAIAADSYFTFTLTASGADLPLDTLSFNYWVTAPATTIDYSVYVLSDLAGFTDGNQHGVGTLLAGSVPDNAGDQVFFKIDISSLGTLLDGNSVEFRLYLTDNSTATNRIHRIDDITVSTAPPTSDLLTNSGFEDTPFDNGWNSSGVITETGQNGSATSARLGFNTNATLEQTFAPLTDFTIDVDVEVAGNTTDDSFHLFLDGSGGTALELRGSTGNALQVNTNGDHADLTAISGGANFPFPGNTPIRLRIIGRNFGTPTAEYDVVWSAPGSTTFIHAATNLSAFAVPANATSGTGITGVRFDRIGTSGHSYWVDDVILSSTAETPPAADYEYVAPLPDKVVNISGVYPHLAMTNTSNECGPGAIVPWADRLWAVTYSPHEANGSSSKLYEIDDSLNRIIRPESLGGTPANRFIHSPSNQLIIGPHFIDDERNVRNLTYSAAKGRHTGVAAHLTDPDNRLYIMTMENAVYDVNVNDLSVITRYPDVQGRGDRFLHGYHGKGLYSGQGLLVAANNGRPNNQGFPTGEAGVLATWDGTTVADNGGSYLAGNDPNTGIGDNTGAPVAAQANYIAGWDQLHKVQTCEVTGPGGIYGNPNPATDPIWTTAFDAKSVILRTLESGTWHTWRLPKASYSHDGSHGWHTEWPRIRQLDPDTPSSPYLMHMHGLFLDFPSTFSATNFSGLNPLCGYYKMPVDYCTFDGQLVIAKNDASKFSNALARKAQSNMWWGQLEDLADWGAPTGHGSVWMNEAVTNGQTSDPFLINGFTQGTLHLRNNSGTIIPVLVETSSGTGGWSTLKTINVPANSYLHDNLTPLNTEWIRLTAQATSSDLTAFFHLSNPYPHAPIASVETNAFSSIADIRDTTGLSDGVIRVMTSDELKLEFASDSGYHQIGGQVELEDVSNASLEADLRADAALTQEFGSDAASAWIEDDGTKFRVPKLDPLYDSTFLSGWARGEREAVTERKLFNLHGTFYEVPRDNSGGKRKMRALATHGKRITDFASWRGLWTITGVLDDATPSDSLVKNPSGNAALWLGEIDDLWQMGEPRGVGGPWQDTAVTASSPSDPYLMYGYDDKELTLTSSAAATITVEVDFLADDTWSTYQSFPLTAGQTITHTFPSGFHAHWVRVTSNTNTTATAQLTYGPADQRDVLLDWARDESLPTAAGREAVAEANGDGDPMNDLAEFVFGTDPAVANVWPLSIEGNNLVVTLRDLTPEDGITVTFESCTDLESWIPRPDLVSPDPDQTGVPTGFTRLHFAFDPLTESARFVRIGISL
ncbi:hypothetical protein [Haloferula sp.]|uniref:hypothetical protein n=1 Tax=Haloferula sp. TaxID=2497595 RepID=UPI00329F40AB